MSSTAPPRPSPPERPELRADAPDVLTRVQEGLTLVDVMARQLRRQLGGKVSLDELVSFGREGLLGAARTFDASLEVPFRRWANYRIRGAMLDGVRKTSMLPRSVFERLRAIEAATLASEGAAEDGSAQRPTSAEDADSRLSAYLAGVATAVAMGLLGTAIDATGECVDPAPPADEQIGRTELLGAVREAVRALPDAERHLVERHYFDDVQLDEAAREIGLSKSWGSRLHSRAIESITRSMKRTRVGP